MVTVCSNMGKIVPSKEELIDLYFTRGLSLREIVEEVGWSYSFLQKLMTKSYGLRLRRYGPSTFQQRERFRKLRREMYKQGLYEMPKDKGILGRKQPAEEKERRANSLRGKRRTSEQCQNISRGIREHYRNPINRERLFRKLNLRPNRVELRLEEILDSLYPGEYKYVGDGKFFVGGKNPDFVCESKKKIVELFGESFHDPQCSWKDISYESTELGRIEFLAKNGWDALIIWSKEVYWNEENKAKQDHLVSKIQGFHVK